MAEDAELPERARRWVLASVPRAVAVRGAVRLHGGISADTHLITVERAASPPLELVLKRLKRGRGTTSVEAVALTALSGRAVGFAAPLLVAEDPLAEACDTPAILMTRVPGQIALELLGWKPRVAALGRALAGFHAANVACPASIPDQTAGLVARRSKLVPAGIVTPDWARVWRLVEGFAMGGDALLHGDYHIGNALFEAGELTGIVDWASARRGAREFDVCYCRLDLAMVIGPAAPRVFTLAYEAASGTTLRDLARWDLAASVQAYPDPALWLPGWVDAGRTDLTPDLIRSRLGDFIEQVLVAL